MSHHIEKTTEAVQYNTAILMALDRALRDFAEPRGYSPAQTYALTIKLFEAAYGFLAPSVQDLPMSGSEDN